MNRPAARSLSRSRFTGVTNPSGMATAKRYVLDFQPVGVDRPRLALDAAAPDCTEQPLPRERAIAPNHEGRQELELEVTAALTDMERGSRSVRTSLVRRRS